MSEQLDHAPYNDSSVSEDEDDGTMPASIAELAQAVVGHRIVAVEKQATIPETESWRWGSKIAPRLTLDDGTQVFLADTSDCCAYTEVYELVEHLPSMDHVITSVTSTAGYTRWHLIADLGEVLELQVGWSSGNPFYYSYGIDLIVVPTKES